MNRRDRANPPKPGMIWSEKYGLWVDPDARSVEQRIRDEAVALNVEADRKRLNEVIARALNAESEQATALENVAIHVCRSFIGRMTEARKSSGLSQSEVARRMSVPQSAVVRLEAGAHSPTLMTIARYATAVGFRIDLTQSEGSAWTQAIVASLTRMHSAEPSKSFLMIKSDQSVSATPETYRWPGSSRERLRQYLADSTHDESTTKTDYTVT
jgi:transcriptional regulator with XRE-family HTH domain